jgi:hypothetical protein
MTIPAFEADRVRRYIAFADAIGLIIHPVGSPHSGRLLPDQDESENPTGSALAETGARLSGINQQKQRLSGAMVWRIRPDVAFSSMFAASNHSILIL